MPEFSGCHGPEFARDLDVDSCCLLKTAALHQPYGGVDNRFCREAVVRSRFEPEDVARKMKRADLAPSVRQQLVAPDGAADDLINVFRWLLLAVDLLILPVGKFGRHEAHMPGQGTKLVGNGGGNGCNLVTGNLRIERLGEHGPSPLRRMDNCYASRSKLEISFDILGGAPYVVYRRSRWANGFPASPPECGLGGCPAGG